MPVYEFYCPDCHAIYSFFSRRIDTATRPDCPRCRRPALERQASLFAISRNRGETGDGSPDADLPEGVDEDKLMRAFASMAGDLEQLDENDPKQAARMMRRLFAESGLKLGDGMAEAIRRMEAGEDPDQIDAELGDVLENEDPFGAASLGKPGAERLKQLRRELLPPARDGNWYPLRPSGPSPENTGP
jgi:putative FmdB family regulatory protein